MISTNGVLVNLVKKGIDKLLNSTDKITVNDRGFLAAAWKGCSGSRVNHGFLVWLEKIKVLAEGIRVLDRGEKIELLVDKTENLQFQNEKLTRDYQGACEGKRRRKRKFKWNYCRVGG
ncbi:hypothetical protein R6Q59_010456 [Mikania micrantha]